MSDYDDHSIFDPELDAARKETAAYKFGELSDAVHGCAMAVADQLFAPILAEVTWAVNHLTAIGEWFYEKVLRGKR